MSTTVPKHFDAETRNQFAQAQEIQIETRRPVANVLPLRRTIWVVVAGEEVFLRSVCGNTGRWYQAIKANSVALITVDGQQVQVQAMLVTDDVTLARVSDAYRQQYRTSPYLPPLLHQETVPTTLRLEPL